MKRKNSFRRAKVKPEGVEHWYSGTCHLSDMEPDAKAAYQSWVDQRFRCRNKNAECYSYYGAKGVEVRYSAREFVGWWLHENKRLGLKKPTVSRIDHNGHYEFGNVKLEEHLENCVTDVFKRHGAPGLKCKRKVVCLDAETMTPLMIFDSGVDASKATGVERSNIPTLCRGYRKDGTPYRKTLWGITFRYLDEWEGDHERAA